MVRREPYFIVVLSLCMIAAGCDSSENADRTFEGNNAFRGKITVVVAKPVSEGFDDLFTYVYDLDSGVLSLQQTRRNVSNAAGSTGDDVKISPFATGSISCYSGPELKSPDGKLTASCEATFPGVLGGNQSDFLVIKDAQGKVVRRQGNIWYKTRIVGYAWAPDSRSFVIYSSYSSTSWSPLDLISAIASHPIPVYDFDGYVFSLVDKQQSLHLPYSMAGVRMGFAMITSWK